MLSILPIVALLAVCANAASIPDIDRPNEDYLNAMCYPLTAHLKGAERSEEALLAIMKNSPFPCEQYVYLEMTCLTHRTTPNDFLAEQQCLCGGNFFEVIEACSNCYIAHGGIATPSDLSSASSVMTKNSLAECSPTPPIKGYTNIFAVTQDVTSYMQRSDITLSSDNFPSDTRVENYWTGATAPIAGKITGSAVQHLSSTTNAGSSRITSTGAAVTGGNATTTSAPTSTGSGDAATSTGGAAEVRVAGGLLAAVIGVLAVL
ncbi:hypothetical protein VE03_08290 [Pseudogymnoascus sp. 23342-1-I1]|nr:hypothetical protein VE03_08290 [Pseudogymnoascus sp. 23342-1-I1]